MQTYLATLHYHTPTGAPVLFSARVVAATEKQARKICERRARSEGRRVGRIDGCDVQKIEEPGKP